MTTLAVETVTVAWRERIVPGSEFENNEFLVSRLVFALTAA